MRHKPKKCVSTLCWKETAFDHAYSRRKIIIVPSLKVGTSFTATHSRLTSIHPMFSILNHNYILQ